MFSEKIMNKKVKDLNLNDIVDIAHTLGLDLDLTLVPIKDKSSKEIDNVKPTEEIKTKPNVIHIGFNDYLYNDDIVWALALKDPDHNTEINVEFVCVGKDGPFRFPDPIKVESGDFVKFGYNYWEFADGSFVLSTDPEKLLLEKKIENEYGKWLKENSYPQITPSVDCIEINGELFIVTLSNEIPFLHTLWREGDSLTQRKEIKDSFDSFICLHTNDIIKVISNNSDLNYHIVKIIYYPGIGYMLSPIK